MARPHLFHAAKGEIFINIPKSAAWRRDGHGANIRQIPAATRAITTSDFLRIRLRNTPYKFAITEARQAFLSKFQPFVSGDVGEPTFQFHASRALS